MAGHNHFPLATPATVHEPADPAPVHGPDRAATYRELCRGISEALPVPSNQTIPQDPAGRVQLVVADRAAVEAWAAWLGAGSVLAHPLPDRSRRFEARLPGWLGWTAIIVTARAKAGAS
jgi:hypothetical protein